MNELIDENDDGKLEVQTSEEKYQIVLPCDVKDFRTFVSGLLGKPQLEKGKIEGSFHVEPKHISNIFHLINQRVTQQNDGSIIHFSIEVLYDNGTSVSHNNTAHFESYYPTSDTHPIEIVLSFTYLIKFKNKEAPEKQEITVVISSDRDRLHSSEAWLAGGLFEYRISHTDKTWSSDIANVLKNHASNFIDEHKGIIKFLTRYDDDIFEYTFWIVLLGYCTYWYNSVKSKFFSETETNLDLSNLAEHTINFAYIFFTLIVFTKIIEKIAAYRFFIRRMSFITLIDKDYDKMRKAKSKSWWKMTGYFVSLLLNVCAGVVASYIYGITAN